MTNRGAAVVVDVGGWAPLAIQLLSWATRGLDTPIVVPDGSTSLYPQLRARGLDSLLGFALRTSTPEQRIYNQVFAHQIELARAFVSAANAEGIECLTLKGLPLSRRWYPEALGCMSDIDVLVPRQDVLRTIGLMYQLGLRPQFFDQERGKMKLWDISEMTKAELEHYELVGYSKCVTLALDAAEEVAFRGLNKRCLRIIGGLPTAILEIDVHHAVATDVDSEQFFIRSQSTDDLGRTLSDADHLWFGLSRLYVEVALHGKSRLREFAYLGPLISQGKVDWSVIIGVAKSLELRPSLFYFTTFLDRLAGGFVPKEVLTELDPRLGSRYRDWGWQVGRLFDQVDPCPSLIDAIHHR